MAKNNVCASVAELDRQSHYAMPGRRLRMLAIDSILKTCGIERLGAAKKTGRPVYYCNGGETYAATVFAIGNRLIVSSCGDLIETGYIKET